MNTSNGFSLIELIITVAILGITASVAVPAFRTVVVTNQVSTQVNELVAGINLARSEAVKRGRSIRVAAINGAWSNGWQVCLDGNDDGDCADTDDELLRSRSPSSNRIVVSNSDLSLNLDARGGMASGTGSAFSFTPRASDCPEGAMFGRSLSVGVSGHASISKVACAAEGGAG